ncbi:hypothetical protein Tco_0339278 [Tanacetum coccineum]
MVQVRRNKIQLLHQVQLIKFDLEEFDLKSALFKHMNKIKSANRNTANYHLYHALMEALIADEDAMDKEVADKVKDHKRKHDSDDDEDDDDDKGPSVGSNQVGQQREKDMILRIWVSSTSIRKDDDQSFKEPRSLEASASNNIQLFLQLDWQSRHKIDIPMQDKGRSTSDMEDTDKLYSQVYRQQPKINWANTYATTYQVPEENKLQRKTYDIGSFIKWFCRRTGKKKLCKADLEGPAFNLEDTRSGNYSTTILLQQGSGLSSDRLKVNADMTSVQSMASLTGGLGERNSTSTNTVSPLSEAVISRSEFSVNRGGRTTAQIKSYQTKINLERPNWDAADYYFKEDYTIVPKPRAVVYKDRNDQRKLFIVEYNKGMENRKWSEDDKRRSKDFITAIEKRLQIIRIYRSLESFVGGRIRDIDYTADQQNNVTTSSLQSKVRYGINPNDLARTGGILPKDKPLVSVEVLSYKRSHKGVKASANSDIIFFFTSAQDGEPLQDDVRLCLGDDLKKAQDHS